MQLEGAEAGLGQRGTEGSLALRGLSLQMCDSTQYRGVMSIHRSALTDGEQATIIPCKLSKEQNVVLLLEECRFY